MPRKKKEETLVHLDLDTLSKPARRPRETVVVEGEKTPLTVGDFLVQARIRKKLKPEDIARKLRIKEVYLEALEKGHYYAFPGLVYGVGFLRTYATFLGLDANELIERFYQETSDIETEPLDMPQADNTNALPSPACVFKAIGILIVLYVGWLIVQSFFAAPETPITLPQPVEVAIEEMKPIVQEVIPAPVQSEEPESVVAEKIQEPDKAVQPVVQRTPVTYGLKEPARVSFVATADVWIEVKDSMLNRVLLSKVLHPDDRYNPAADTDGLVLKTANAGAISVYVDGKFIKKLGRKGVIKSGILMNADDLLKE